MFLGFALFCWNFSELCCKQNVLAWHMCVLCLGYVPYCHVFMVDFWTAEQHALPRTNS